LDTRLDAGDVSCVKTCSEQLEQQQEQQQELEVSTCSAHTAVNSSGMQHRESTPLASPGSLSASAQPCADTLEPSLHMPAGCIDAPGCSSRRQSASDAAVDGEDGGDCLVIEPEWVTPDGEEVDLNKVSDYELRLAKVRALPACSVACGDIVLGQWPTTTTTTVTALPAWRHHLVDMPCQRLPL
jgi:hypothetical protein